MEEQKEVKQVDKAWRKDALMMFSRLSLWVAFPVILASLLGQWLDERFGTKPWILVVCVVVAFDVTIIVLVKETGRVFKKIEDDEKDKKSDK